MELPNGRHVSESSLDVFIPSFPGTPRSLNLSRQGSDVLLGEDSDIRHALEYLHTDSPLLEAAELGDWKRIEEMLMIRDTDLQFRDHLGRTALHLAMHSGSEKTIKLLLDAGIRPTIKDNLGMTPLSLCLMRSPSLAIANLLFEHGAVLLPRVSPMDTGLFIQFVAMCVPTDEDEKLLDLLVSKGGLINDPGAPGGRQPLHIAAMGNNCRLIKKLLELGADPTCRNHRGETPRMFARAFKCKEAYELLDEYDVEASMNSESSSSVLLRMEQSLSITQNMNFSH